MGESSTPLAAQDSFIGSIDQGTTSTRFLIFNKDGEPITSHQIEFKQIYPHPGWHEHDPLEIISSIEECIEGAVKSFEQQGHSSKAIKAVGITNQRETTVLKSRLGADKLQNLCGLPLSTYPSVGKLLWLIENEPKVVEAYENGRLAFGTIDAWVVYKLNGGPKKNVHVTDPTNASRSMFMNIHTLKYDEQLLDFFRFDMKKLHLPRIVRSSHPTEYGTLSTGILSGVPIAGCLGDQSAALVGQKGFSPGRAKNTYGTGCFLLYNVGDKPVISSHGLLSTVAYDFDGTPQYALEGSIAVAGSSIKFLQNNFGFIGSSSQISQLAETVPDNGGCTFVTAFSGLFAPYWIDDARGTIFGITAYTQKGHIARATLEATCFQTKAILDSMQKDSGHALAELAVDGADLIGIPVERPRMLETTALGAAIAAGFAVSVWENFEQLKNVNTAGITTFMPKIAPKEREQRLAKWQKAVEMCKGWAEGLSKVIIAMHSSLILSLLLALSSATTTDDSNTTAKTIIPKDCFSSQSKFDTYFDYLYPWGSDHNGAARMDKAHVSLSDSHLTLTAEPVKGQPDASHGGKAIPIHYLSGAVHAKEHFTVASKGGFDFSGEFQATTTKGTWPAFWLTAVKGWPPEIDMAEWKGSGKISFNTFDTSDKVAAKDVTYENPGEWHKIRAELRADGSDVKVKFYLNDDLVTTQTGKGYVGQALYLIINLQMEGSSGSPGPTKDTTYSARNLEILSYNP
ncbi:hypothetical protein G7Y89_g4229 [Cudoniella acicularis]|uniref:glycerol kinase n=1 Tax=Cudoniella acicularis TaxID=354080 RepID=A0A8H4W4W5_9HELO|nr:hypothetical protein G7Y89_g4229 [Cudoniella acicularis]